MIGFSSFHLWGYFPKNTIHVDQGGSSHPESTEGATAISLVFPGLPPIPRAPLQQWFSKHSLCTSSITENLLEMHILRPAPNLLRNSGGEARVSPQTSLLILTDAKVESLSFTVLKCTTCIQGIQETISVE